MKRAEAHLQLDPRTLRRALRAVRAFSRSATDHDAWYDPHRVTQLELIPALGRCRRIVYATKLTLGTQLIVSGGGVPPSVEMLSRPGIVPRCYADLVRREAHATGAELTFAGDLEPFALTTYLSLLAGGFDGEATTERLLKVRYLGVSDAWLAICREEPRATLRGRMPGAATLQVPLTEFQKRHLEVLEGSGVPWDALVGPEAMGILRSGNSVALELACNPEHYGPGFMRKLSRYLSGAKNS